MNFWLSLLRQLEGSPLTETPRCLAIGKESMHIGGQVQPRTKALLDGAMAGGTSDEGPGWLGALVTDELVELGAANL